MPSAKASAVAADEPRQQRARRARGSGSDWRDRSGPCGALVSRASSDRNVAHCRDCTCRTSSLHVHCRSAAAAANGPTTRLTRVSAHRIVNGVPNGTGPTIAAFEAATPKISTGIVSGSTSTASSKPPRRSATVSAAPIRPMKVSAGVPASSVSATRAGRRRIEIEQQAEQRRGDHQRQPGGEPMRQRLGGERKFERRARHQDQVERAVLVVRRRCSRSSASRLASSAPSHRIAGPDPRRAARGRGRSRTASASPRSGRTARRSARRRRPAPRAACRAARRAASAVMRRPPRVAPSRAQLHPLPARASASRSPAWGEGQGGGRRSRASRPLPTPPPTSRGRVHDPRARVHDKRRTFAPDVIADLPAATPSRRRGRSGRGSPPGSCRRRRDGRA